MYLVVYVPPSTSLRSGNRPGRLDAYKVSINKYHVPLPLKAVKRAGAWASIPFREMTSLMVGGLEGY